MALYPPIVASSMPAFNYEDNVRIYFSLSGYNSNSIDDIRKVHMSVRYQNSNLNALSAPEEIISKDIQTDQAVGKYYITLLKTDLAEGEFIPDRLYKVQLRFSEIEGQQSYKFYTEYVENFSQWSTVCIIKPIIPPRFFIEDFDREQKGQDSQITDENKFFSYFADFVMTYKQEKSTQVLKSWRVRILNNSFTREDMANIDSYVLVDSNSGLSADTGYMMVSANNYNLNANHLSLDCYVPCTLSSQQDYKVYVEILTKNDYNKGILYNFTYDPQQISSIEGGMLNTYVNNEQGYIKLDFSAMEKPQITNLVIRRTDSKSSFTKWEDLKNFEFKGQDIKENNRWFTYYDFTAESGILYRYLVQKRDTRGRRGTPTFDKSSGRNGIIGEWEHAFLLEDAGDGKVNKVEQLKMKYDFQISSYKTNVSESKTDTIGSKYPFIRRNGNMYYRSFPVTGTITAYMDQAELFVREDDLYNNFKNQYYEFKGLTIGDNNLPKESHNKYSIYNYSNIYDYTKERLFREKVEKFLYNSKPKLYKSMQEGNIFVKLMEVSLTPKKELGRLIYSFSATAYEIDDACIDTYDRYNLISIGTYNPNLYKSRIVVSQLSSHDSTTESGMRIFEKDKDIVGVSSSESERNSVTIANKIKFGQTWNGIKIKEFKITWLRLTMESQPYLIIRDKTTKKLRPADDLREDLTDDSAVDKFDKPISYPLYQIEATYEQPQTEQVYLGWLFEINDQQIVIAHPNYIYELKQDDFSFNQSVKIIPKADTVMDVDYRVDLHIIEDVNLIPKNIQTDRMNGQLIGPFDPNINIINMIGSKYKFNYQELNQKTAKTESVRRRLKGVQSLLIDTEPGTVVTAQTHYEKYNNTYRFVVNETGELNFSPPGPPLTEREAYITSFYVIGKRIPMPENVITVTNKEQDIPYPVIGQVCIENGKYYCYYDRQWCICDEGKALSEDSYETESNILDVHCKVDGLIFYLASVERKYYGTV